MSPTSASHSTSSPLSHPKPSFFRDDDEIEDSWDQECKNKLPAVPFIDDVQTCSNGMTGIDANGVVCCPLECNKCAGAGCLRFGAAAGLVSRHRGARHYRALAGLSLVLIAHPCSSAIVLSFLLCNMNHRITDSRNRSDFRSYRCGEITAEQGSRKPSFCAANPGQLLASSTKVRKMSCNI